MNEKLQIILHLYGEAPDEESLPELLADEESRREYRALGEAKYVLDHRRRERPDPAVLDAVFAAAAGDPGSAAAASPTRRARADRAPAPRLSGLRRRSAGVVGVVLAMGLLVSVGLWQWMPAGVPPAAELASEAPLPEAPSFADGSSAAPALPPAASSVPHPEASSPAGNGVVSAPSPVPFTAPTPGGAGRSMTTTPFSADWQPSPAPLEARADAAFAASAEAGSAAPGSAASPSPEAVFEWRDSEEQLRAFYRRLEQLQARSEGLSWNEPALPLEMLPASGRGDRALQPARQQH